MAFSLERDMMPMVIRAPFFRSLGCSLIYALEVAFNSHVVDVAIADIGNVPLDEWGIDPPLKAAISKMSMLELDVLSSFVDRKQVSIQQLRRRTGRSSSDIRRAFLEQFADAGLIRQVGRYTYSATAWVDAVPSTIVALELKRSNWRKALAQAMHNAQFADFSLVALDAEAVSLSEVMIDSYREANVGLLLVSRSGPVTVVIKPRKNRHLVEFQKSFQQMKVVREILASSGRWQPLPYGG